MYAFHIIPQACQSLIGRLDLNEQSLGQPKLIEGILGIQNKASKKLDKNMKIQRIFGKYPGHLLLLLYYNKTIPESVRIKLSHQGSNTYYKWCK